MKTHFPVLAAGFFAVLSTSTFCILHIYLFKLIKYLSDELDNIYERIIELQNQTFELENNVLQTERSLQLMSLQYLYRTGTLHARGVFELFLNRFLTSYEGIARDKWIQLFRSNNPVSNQIMAALNNRDFNSVVSLATNLYSHLSNEIHPALRYLDCLYIVRDNLLSEDQLSFLQAIARCVIPPNKIRMISRDEYRMFIEDF